MKKLFIIGLMGICFIATSCLGPSRTVKRIDSESTIDLSGRWNDTDSKLVSSEMIKDVLIREWLPVFETKYSKKPVVIVGTIRNLSSEHINVETFVKDIEKELINSGKVKFVASKTERTEVREERQEQQANASLETMKKIAQETGADFMLKGSIKTIEDELDRKKIVFYQIDLELIDIQKNEKVWIGDKKIKKLISKKSFSW
ncbi:MAG: penicillin-binding protein activator LpoB [bacterium]